MLKWCARWTTAGGLQGLESLLSTRTFALLGVPVDAGQLGDQALFSGMPILRFERAADARAVCATSRATRTARSTSFIDLRDVAQTRPAASFTGEPYYLGVSCGRVPEILGDLHNCSANQRRAYQRGRGGRVLIDDVIKGDTVREVLAYVQIRRRS